MVLARLEIYQSRNYFEENTLTGNTPVSIYGEYLFSRTPSRILRGKRYNQSWVNFPVNNCYTIPQVYDRYVFFVDEFNQVRRLKFDPTQLNNGNPQIDQNIVITTVTPGEEVYPVSESNFFAVLVNAWGVRIRYYNGSFSQPVYHLNVGAENASYSFAAVDKYLYIGSRDGSVWAVEWFNNKLSDPMLAIRSDLTTVSLKNAFKLGNIIYLVSTFSRYDPKGSFASPYVYNAILWSRDGYNFSMDRHVVFHASTQEVYAVVFPIGNQLIYATSDMGSALNQYYPMPNAQKYTTQNIKGVEGNLSSEYIVRLANFESNALISKGNICDVYVTNRNQQLVQIDRAVIIGIDDAVGVSGSSYEKAKILHLMSESVWRSQVMSHPFYVEIQSKVGEKITDFTAQTYRINTDDAYITPVVDVARKYSFVPTDVPTNTTNNHEITGDWPVTGQVDIEVYGWAFNYSNGVNLPGVRVSVEFLRGDTPQTMVGTPTTAITFPKNYPDVISGAYPVTYRFGLQAGDRIQKVTIAMINNTASNAVYYIYRIKLIGAMEYIKQYYETAFSKVSTKYSFNPIGSGVYFATRPYSTINCDLMAFGKATYLQMKNYKIPSWFGLILLGVDKNNYVVVRGNIDNIQLVRVKDGVETILSNWTNPLNPVDKWWLRVRHINGVFTVYAGLSKNNLIQIGTYTWNLSEKIVTSDIHHVGMYYYRAYYPIYLGPYNSEKSVVLPVLSSLNDLPTSGVIYTSKNQISYGGVVTYPYGDYTGAGQGRCTYLDWSYSKDGHYFRAPFVDFTISYWHDGDYNRYTNYYLSIDNGIQYKIRETDFKPHFVTAGQNQWYPNRSRHFSDDIKTSDFGTTNYGYISGCLTSPHPKEKITITPMTAAYLAGNPPEIVEAHLFSGDPALTTRDIIEMIASMAGASASFDGDKTYTNLIVSGEIRL